MKKLIALLLAMTMVFALCACGAKEEAAPAVVEEAAPVEEADPAAEPVEIIVCKMFVVHKTGNISSGCKVTKIIVGINNVLQNITSQ